MALTGLEIFKLLPKTNCKKCGFPTCLAFAMALAQKKISLEQCPDVTEETKQILTLASEPPIRTITIGSNERKIELGGETVLFRHEKTFYHPCGLGIMISDDEPQASLKEKIKNYNELKFERVGTIFRTEFIALKNTIGKPDPFIELCKTVKQETSAIPILISKDLNVLQESMKIMSDLRPLIYCATSENWESFTKFAMENSLPLVVSGKDLDELVEIVKKITTMGYRELVLEIKEREPKVVLENLTLIRRLALKRTFRPLGYPTIVFIENEDPYETLSQATMCIAKYASIIILPEDYKWLHLPLITLRMNIYSDPQKPIKVEPKLYAIGGTPDDKSPLLVTTNFSLTYYSVEPEIVSSKIPSWLLVVETDGLSVLTAFAAEKFTPEVIVDWMKKENVEEKVSHQKIIIPGYVAAMSNKLKELTNWEVVVGPREATGIPKFLKTVWSG